MAKLEIQVLVGGESKQFLADLTNIVDRLEALAANGTVRGGAAETTDAGAEQDDTPEEKTVRSVAKNKAAAAKKAAAKVEASDDGEEDFDLEAPADDSGDDEAPVFTKKDLIAACRDNRELAIKTLKKLKVTSVHELKPSQYAKVMAEIGA